VARLAGLEAALLGTRSRIVPVLGSHHGSDLDSLSFGHVLFEMCSGYELDTGTPGPGHLLDLHAHPQILEILDMIFETSKPASLETLLRCDLFRNIDLREMRNQAQSTVKIFSYLFNQVMSSSVGQVHTILPIIYNKGGCQGISRAFRILHSDHMVWIPTFSRFEFFLVIQRCANFEKHVNSCHRDNSDCKIGK